MKDCSSCKLKPEAGTEYRLTPCSRCKPWEAENSKRTMAQKPSWWWVKQAYVRWGVDSSSRI